MLRAALWSCPAELPCMALCPVGPMSPAPRLTGSSCCARMLSTTHSGRTTGVGFLQDRRRGASD